MLLSFSLPPMEGLNMAPRMVLGPALNCGQLHNTFVPTPLPHPSSSLPGISYLNQEVTFSQTLLSGEQDQDKHHHVRIKCILGTETARNRVLQGPPCACNTSPP